MVSGISHSPFLLTEKRVLSELFMEGQLRQKFLTRRMTGLDCSTGLVKESQVPKKQRTRATRVFIRKAYWCASGRGVLIDYASYAEKNGIKYSTFSTHQIRLVDILNIAKECNITFQRGDILLVRIGVTKEWDNIMSNTQKQDYALSSNPEHAGVEATTDVLRWLWDTRFSAIAGDAISWEVRFRIPVCW